MDDNFSDELEQWAKDWAAALDRLRNADLMGEGALLDNKEVKTLIYGIVVLSKGSRENYDH